MAETADNAQPITIKKYANRRLYNTATSSYVTLDHLAQMVKEGIEFTVRDAKTGDDITRSVLTQIIVEEEAKGTNLLPIGFLRQLIRFYGDSLQWLVPRYLDHTMTAFSSNQDQMRSQMQEAFGGFIGPFGSLEEMGKQNMAMLERTMRMFSPFPVGETPQPPRGDAAKGAGMESGKEIADLKEQVSALREQIESLRGDSDKS